MAHNIEKSELGANASVFVVGEPAWHRLGKVLENPQTAEEALKLANLDFDVRTFPVFTSPPSVGQVNVPGTFTTVRTDTNDILGVVGNQYRPIQNRDAFKFFDEIVGEKAAIYHSAGVLGKGERVWVMAKLPSYIKIGKGDDVELNVVISNSHDGKSSMVALLSPVRVVCENTLNSAIQNHRGLVRIKHTTNADDYIRQAHKVLGLMVDQSKLLEQAFTHLASIKVSAKIRTDFVNFVIPSEKLDTPKATQANRDALMDSIFRAPGQGLATAKGTAWGLFNGYTHYLDYVAEGKNDSRKLYRTWFGYHNTFKANALEYLLTVK